MTGYTVHTGTTVKFAGGWDRIFSGKTPAKNAAASVKKAASKKAVKKSARAAVKKTPKKKTR